MWRQIACVLGISLLGCGCASSIGPHGTAPAPAAEIEQVRFPPYRGPKQKIHVVQINIPADDIKRYPELGEKRVGFGLSNVLVETLFDTGRFTFLEEKEQILRRLLPGGEHRLDEQDTHLCHQRWGTSAYCQHGHR